MGMTMTQKILAAAAGLEKVEAGQLIEAKLDLVLGNDITSPVAIHEMDKFNQQEVFDKIKSLWLWITLFRTRTSNPRSTANVSVNLPVVTRSPIISMWERWESNMRCFRKKD